MRLAQEKSYWTAKQLVWLDETTSASLVPRPLCGVSSNWDALQSPKRTPDQTRPDQTAHVEHIARGNLMSGSETSRCLTVYCSTRSKPQGDKPIYSAFILFDSYFVKLITSKLK